MSKMNAAVETGAAMSAALPAGRPTFAESGAPMQGVPEKKIVMGARYRDEKEFAGFVEAAAAMGATHVSLANNSGPSPYTSGSLARKARNEIFDPTDPYLQWNIGNGAIFRFAVPEKLKGLIPEETARENLDFLKARCAILRQHGLKGFWQGVEPNWLPERVYEKYPSWRGPRVDQPRRSHNAYFAPCVDNPEVLEVYREGMSALAKACPEVDTFHLLTNDSGGGYCWAAHLYNGLNGPEACRSHPMRERIAGFCQALQEGARRSGVTIEIEIANTFTSPFGREDDELRLVPIPGVTFARYASAVTAGPSNQRPIIGVMQPMDFFTSASRGWHGDAKKFTVQFGDALQIGQFDFYRKVLGEARKAPVKNYVESIARLGALATEETGSADVVEAWLAIREANRIMAGFRDGGDMFALYHLMQRLLVRPYVPFPMELTDAEKGYYRPYLFQATSEEDAANLMNHQGSQTIKGLPQAGQAEGILNAAASDMETASRIFRKVAAAQREGRYGAPEDAAKRDSYELQADAAQASAYLIKSLVNAILFQALIDARKEELLKVPYDPRKLPTDVVTASLNQLLVMEKFRNEIDNTNDLIKLLTESRHTIFATAATPEEEDPFGYGPDLIENLRTKVRTMMRHWKDFDRLWAPQNL